MAQWGIDLLLGAFVYDVAAWNARVVWDVKLPGTSDRLSC
jgi:hypothetical protein